MKYILAVILISLFIITSYNFVAGRLAYNNCMERIKLDYITEKGAAHIGAQCRTFILEKVFTN